MQYIILSLSHSTIEEPMFWRANDMGYTNSPFAAGKYTEEQVKENPDYYNNGLSTVAIPLTDEAMYKIGFKVSIDFEGVDRLHSELYSSLQKAAV